MAREKLCRICIETRPTIDGIRAVAYFEGQLRSAVHRFKYHGARALARPLARLMTEYQSAHRLPADVIVPVPLHPERKTERGFNQSSLLAQALGADVGLPVVEAILARVRATVPQVNLTARERGRNVAGAFQAQRDLAGQRILLIDDVCTTGATMEACAQALKAGGASSVWGLALARGR